ncbi:MAG: N-acetylglucosamine-6-phosphate deacetylase [Planctomycetota bacterium]
MKIPGFVDLQVNGYKGVDFSSPDLTEEVLIDACQALFKAGTAAFLPTVITSSEDIYEKNLPLIASVIDRDEFKGKLLGIHLEGPFISPEPGAVGAHNPDWVCRPSVEHLEKLQVLAGGHIKLLTLAAELEGVDVLTKYAVKKGITVSLGHQMAGCQEMKKLYDAGAQSITHFGNGMPNQVPRHHNPITAALAIKKLKAMIITDGHHLPESVIRMVFNAKEVGDIIVTSDASPIAGLKPGKYHVLGNEAVLEENGLLHNPQKQCMVGSSATMLECMNHLASLDILSVQDLLKVGFTNPSELIGIGPSEIESRQRIAWNDQNRQFEIIKS